MSNYLRVHIYFAPLQVKIYDQQCWKLWKFQDQQRVRKRKCTPEIIDWLMLRKVKFPIEMRKNSAKYPPYIIPRSGTIKSKVLALSNEVFPFCVRTFCFGRIERQPLIRCGDCQLSHASYSFLKPGRAPIIVTARFSHRKTALALPKPAKNPR